MKLFNSKIFESIDKRLIILPTPVNISSFWNFGFLLRICLIIQIVTGLFLSFHYSRDISRAFNRINHIYRDVNYGWLIRIIHRNFARIFFLCLYIHIGRGIYYESYYLIDVWNRGVTIFILRIATAFFGYVLPWGQISLWGATVITNLFSVIPFIGINVVEFLWGGFSVDAATLNRFFSFHFVLPFAILGLVIIHLILLHETGSSNPLGLNRNYYKISFYPFFLLKDLVLIIFIFLLSIFLIFFDPWLLADPENFIPANSLVTPIHIQPEWYFLFAYAILRSIPNKVGGVVALLISILILYIIPFINKKEVKGISFHYPRKVIFFFLVNCVIILTWIGARPVEGIYIVIGKIFTVAYFVRFFILAILGPVWEWILKSN